MASTIEQILIAAGEAGAITAKGADGMMFLAKICYGGAREGTVSAGKDGNLYQVYKAYLAKATKSEYGSRVDVNSDKALKYGVAKLNAFVKFAALPGKTEANWKLVRDAVRVINEDASKKVNAAGEHVGERKIVSRYEQVLKVIRAANDAKKTKLDDDKIREALAPKDPVGDLELKALQRMLKTAQSNALAAGNAKGSFFQAIEAEIEQQIQNYKVMFKIEDEAPASGEDDDTTLEDFLSNPEMGELEAA